MKRKKRETKRNQDSPENQDRLVDPLEIKVCQNCGHEDSGRFCSNCGQSFINLNRPMKEILGDFLGIFSIDRSILNTIRPFLFKPGFLTSEYLAGRRKRYMSPVKLYIFLSIVFFFVARMSAIRSDGNSNNFSLDVNNDSTETIVPLDSALIDVLKNDTLFYASDNPNDTIDWDDNEISEKFRGSLLNAAENKETYVAGFIKNISYALFILMPLFALILQLLYIRRKRFYVEHLLFSINMHSFALLVLSVVFLLNMIFKWNNNYANFLVLIIPVYFTIGMKRFYKQGLFKILLKELLLGLIYTVLLIAVLGGLALLTLFLI